MFKGPVGEGRTDCSKVVFFLFSLITFSLVAGVTVRISSHSVAVFLSLWLYYFSLQAFSLVFCVFPCPPTNFPSFISLSFSGAVPGQRRASGWCSHSSPGNRCVVLHIPVRTKPHPSPVFLTCLCWLRCLLCHSYGTADLCLHHALVIAQLVGIRWKYYRWLLTGKTDHFQTLNPLNLFSQSLGNSRRSHVCKYLQPLPEPSLN